MKVALVSILLLAFSGIAQAVAPGGGGCGWGNKLFEGDSGTASHVLAVTTNGTSGNNTFGMSSGTNGCKTDGSLTYDGGEAFARILNEFSEDVAIGHGDALTAVAVMMGVEAADRDTFAEITHDNFKVIFPNENVTAKEVYSSLQMVMKSDERLAKYVS